MSIKRAYRYRFYPTDDQEAILAKTFGCARYVYNAMLDVRTRAWQENRARVGYHETSAMLTLMKQTPEHVWLNDVSSVPLQQSLRHLNRAFENFFKKRGLYPSFKSRHDKQAAEYTTSGFRWNGASLTLAKMDEPLDIRWSRPIPAGAVPTTVTVSRDAAGRHFVSILCTDAVEPLPEVEGQVGVDLGLNHFAILSNGEKIGNPKIFRKHERRLARLQRNLSRKQEGSNNRRKAKIKVARLQARISDSRKDFLHKLSTRLIRENQVIAVESLAVANLKRNRHLSKSISDAGWSMFVGFLAYKAGWYGRTLLAVDRWYPSSKLCSNCGHRMPSMPLKIREWGCPKCGTLHDRDVNAARNILAAGHAVAVCGENVSPMALY